MSQASRHTLLIVRRRLRAAWRRMTLVRMLGGLAFTVCVLGASLLIILAAESRYWVDTSWRSFLFWAWIISAAILFSGLLLWPMLVGWRGRTRYKDIAHSVSLYVPEVQDRLTNLLELGSGEASDAPQPIVDGAVQMLGQSVEDLPVERAVNFTEPIRFARWAVLPLAGLALFLLAAPQSFFSASTRLFSPGVVFERPAPFSLLVSPGTVEITRGDTLVVTVGITGREFPDAVRIEFNRSGERTSRVVPMASSEADVFIHHEPGVRGDLHYRILAGPVVTSWYEVSVLDRPILRNLQVDLHPPAYTGLPARHLPSGTGNITALRGTRAEIRVGASGENVTAHLAFDRAAQNVILSEMTGSFEIRQPDTYRIHLVSGAGVFNEDPVTYTITPVEDRYPVVQIVAPEPEAELDLSLIATLSLQLGDDFGFTRLTLYWRLVESRFGDVMDEYEELPLNVPLSREVVWDWLINPTTGVDMVPGDVIAYYVRVWDNDAYSGFKSASSATHRLRLPSLAERYKELEIIQDDAESGLESLLEEAEHIREEFDALQEELRRKQDADWDDQRQLERLTEAQEELESRVEELSEAMERAAQQMEDHGLVSDELLSIFEELQGVTDEINAPELMEALRELQEAIEELSPRNLQQSLEKFAFNEEQFRERLERTLDLFKNFQVQQKLDEAARRAEDLREVQENLAEATREDPNDAKPLAKEQERASEDMAALEEKMADIERRMEELRNAPQSQMSTLNEETRAQALPQRLLKNAQQMMEGQMRQANQGQQQMGQNMQQLQSNLQQVQQNMQGQQMRINMAALQRVLSDILLLSHDEEDLRRRVAETTTESLLLRSLAQEQATFARGARMVIDSLHSLARTMPQMTRDVQQHAGMALQSMIRATDHLAERNTRQAEAEGGAAMTSLNELALLLSDLMDQLMNAASSASSGGMSMEQMIQQLQQMAAQQRDLNRALEDLLGQNPGERLSVDLQERMRQLASQQESIRRDLRKMGRSRELANRLTGDLDEIARQMEESIRELQLGRSDRRMQERQQQILTRLLDASKSLHERGKQKKREGKTGITELRQGPDELILLQSEDELRRALLQALESGYARDYQDLIRRYFEMLQER